LWRTAREAGRATSPETDETAPSGLKLCRLYYADRDYLVPDWRLPLGSFVKFSDPWDVEEATLPDVERERIEARVATLIAAESS
jgi:hypothetical protein